MAQQENNMQMFSAGIHFGIAEMYDKSWKRKGGTKYEKFKNGKGNHHYLMYTGTDRMRI